MTNSCEESILKACREPQQASSDTKRGTGLQHRNLVCGGGGRPRPPNSLLLLLKNATRSVPGSIAANRATLSGDIMVSQVPEVKHKEVPGVHLTKTLTLKLFSFQTDHHVTLSHLSN